MFSLINSKYTLITMASILSLTYLTASEAVRIAMPVLVWSVVGLLILISLAVSAGMIRYGWSLLAQRVTRLDSDRQLAAMEPVTERLRIEANQALVAVALEQIRAGAIYPVDLTGKFAHLPGGKAIEALALPEPEGGNRIHFEDVCRKALRDRGAGRFIAFGGQGSGKTTLAKYAVKYAADEIAGNVFIIDPHAPQVVWGDDVKVVGSGMKYDLIADFLDYVVADVKARYEAGCGDDSRPLPHPYQANFIVCEEWAGVIAELTAMRRWTPIHNRTFYMDARKAGWGYFLIAHEYTVAALGLTGMSNLLSGVEYFITLDKDAIKNSYCAKIGNSFKDKNPYELVTPGPFRGRMYYSPEQAVSEWTKTDKYLIGPPGDGAYTIDLSEISGPDEYERLVIEVAEKATSWNNLHHLVSNTETNVSGPQAEKYKSILQKHKIRPGF